MISCGENCRYQVDGYCTKNILTVNKPVTNAECCYFEKR